MKRQGTVRKAHTMRVLQRKKRWNQTKLVLLTLGITSIGLVIVGNTLGNPFLIGAGFAGMFLLEPVALHLKAPTRNDLV
jgi:hypothetical protein